MTIEERFMKRALDLAQLGKGRVSPNPLVGCVIVHNGQIIGEGFHQKYGGPHAEVNAVNAVEDQEKLKKATVYVSLEPCSHFGKTPPCSDLLIAKQVKKVVICNVDPNPLVAGRGIEKLKQAGIEVVDGVLAAEGNELNKCFFTSMTQQRPYVILKWAQTTDGFIARENYDSKWISNALSRKWVHKWRAEFDAIMVGTNTAQHDNPTLNVRSWQGENPVRVVLDKELRLNPALKLFDQTIPTICYNFQKDHQIENLIHVQLTNDDTLLPQILTDLHQRNYQSLFVEGGAKLLNAFIDQDLWDEARVFIGKQAFGKGIAAPKQSKSALETHELEGDYLKIYRNLKS
ncbi:MAG: bifunctional diaminohydroxyphosphoribosylaminopyrimidine deaminase/5-amino-6-(5-phosphoribosylamino)uracil reductase RibD [Flammeovirgaceae bacterium]